MSVATRVGSLLVAATAAACGPSVSSQLRPDYPTTDQKTLKHVAIVARIGAAGGEPAARLFSLVARRWANQHRNFIVKRNLAAPALDRAAVCAGQEGVLYLDPGLVPEGDGFEVDLRAELSRCADGEAVWSATVAGSFESDDEHLVELRDHYATELGPEVAPYVPAAMHSVRAAFETLPQPILTEEDEMEKIELGE